MFLLKIFHISSLNYINIISYTKVNGQGDIDDKSNDYAEVRKLLNEFFKLASRKYGYFHDYVSFFFFLEKPLKDKNARRCL